MLTIALLVFLFLAMMLYLVLGGADFGAGLVEATLRGSTPVHDRARGLISRAIAPVWEANHVWLILVVVIVFNGFPSVYTTVSTLLHVPLIGLLLAIVLRGTAFTFRHYDQLDDSFSGLYGALFRVSSFAAPFFIGLIVAALPTGELVWDGETFWQVYVSPWWGLHGVLTGLFTAALCGFIASAFLVGESHDDPAVYQLFRYRCYYFLGGMVLLGAGTFLSGYWAGYPLTQEFFSRGPSAVAFLLASVLLLPFLGLLSKVGWTRFLGSAIVSLVLAGWWGAFFPIAIRLKDAPDLTWYAVAAPPSVQWGLLVALVVGSVLIFPALWFLYATFKRAPES